MDVIQLSPDQELVCQAIQEFIENPGVRKFITIGGYAGTGKTTTIGAARARLGEAIRIAFCAYTGKAASVLASKLDSFDYCGTIHSLIYYPLTDAQSGRILGWSKQDKELPFDLIVIDEASMVNEEIFKDLLEYGIPIIAVGDHGQLPPVKSTFNLMQNPMYRLEKVHRQAEDNPIIKLSMLARTEGAIPFGKFGDGVRKVRGLDHLNEIELNDVMLLCGTNALRGKINRLAREGKGERPEKGEKVICLRNNAKKGIYNGMVGFIRTIHEAGQHWYQIGVEMESGFIYEGSVLRHQFGSQKTMFDWRGPKREEPKDLFDFAYCLTTWKAQGSEADKVVLIEETLGFLSPEDWKRYLYTAVTRAKKELLIIKP